MNETIFEKIKGIMAAEFKVKPDDIKLESDIAEDLDLDSLDMVDLILSLNNDHDLLNKQIDPTLFKDAKKIEDLVNSLEPHWK